MMMTMMQPSIPHVCRVRRLLNMWMRRGDPTKVLRGLQDLFPRAELALLLLPLNCFPRKLGTDRYCKLDRQESFCSGISKHTALVFNR